VKVLGTVAPAHDVHPADPADGLDRPIEPDDQLPELCGSVRAEAIQIDVLSRLEQDENRNSYRLPVRSDPPVLVNPDVRVIISRARAARGATWFAGPW
jgi:hypothetical protein